jgi:hypothetical protein
MYLNKNKIMSTKKKESNSEQIIKQHSWSMKSGVTTTRIGRKKIYIVFI